MHPIIAEQIARGRLEDYHREAAIARRARLARRMSSTRPARPGSQVRRLRLGLAAAALGLARRLDRDGRVVPAAVRAPR